MGERVSGRERNRELISEERFERRTKQAVTTCKKKNVLLEMQMFLLKKIFKNRTREALKWNLQRPI